MQLAFSTLASPAWSIESTVDAAVHMGYDAIEWRVVEGALLSPQTPAATWQRIHRATKTTGITVAALDTSCRFVHLNVADVHRAIAEAKQMIDHAAMIESHHLRVFAGNVPTGMAYEAAVAAAGEALHDVATYARSQGVFVLIETHDHPWAASKDAAALKAAAESDHVGILWDIFHTTRMGESLETSGERLRPICSYIHVKDARHTPDGWQLCSLGEGDLPLSALFAWLHQTHFAGVLSLNGKSSGTLNSPNQRSRCPMQRHFCASDGRRPTREHRW